MHQSPYPPSSPNYGISGIHHCRSLRLFLAQRLRPIKRLTDGATGTHFLFEHAKSISNQFRKILLALAV